MGVKMYLEKERTKRNIGIMELVIGMVCFLISIGLFATMEKYAIPIFAMLVSLFILLVARQTLVEE